MNIIDFFPSYPPIESENFYKEIYEMKEFNVLAKNGMMDGFFHHQLFPARFLAPWTNIYYNSLFLIHDTGTGKSGSIASVLNILKNSNPRQRMLYLTQNEVLIKNFKRELLNLCPYLKKKFEPYKDDDSFKPETVFKSENIEFMTFTTFANKLSTSKYKTKIDYNNAFIVMDEVHQLIRENLKNYRILHKFLNELPRKRLLLATATPMKDNLLEVIYLLNLLLPKKDEFKTGDDFVKEYLHFEEKKQLKNYSQEKLIQYSWKSKEKEYEFKQKIKGYISVFRQKPENVIVRYEGRQVKPLEYSKIFVDELSDFQSDIYKNAWNKDVKNPEGEEDLDAVDGDEKDNYSNFYLNSIQASLMVFPDGTYGKDCKHYLKKITFTTEKTSTTIYDAFNEKFAEETGILKVSTNEERLEIVRKYSQIYYEIIRQIIDPQNQDKCFYVYSDKINGSGILRLINLLLQYFNFSLFKTNYLDWGRKENRCLFLNEKGGVNVDIMKQLEYFNDPRNKNGEYIRVVFGTDKTREGISLKNIQKIHIITPGWNFGKKNQAEGRGIRLNSHIDLQDPTVDIYLHCAIAKKMKMSESVNFLQYIRSEVKEKNNFLFSYAFLTAAVDCQINYYQNFRPDGKNNSLECYFQKCNYTCDGITNTDPKNINVSNFNTYYYVYYLPQTLELLAELFEDKKFVTFEEIRFYISQNSQMTDLLLFETLNKVIDEPITIPNKFQIPLYLKRNDDKFYLSTFKNIPSHNGVLTGEQGIVPCFKINTDTDLMKLYIFNTIAQEKITLLKDLINNDVSKARKFYLSFPLHFQILLEEHLPSTIMKKLNLSVQITDEELQEEELQEKLITNNPYGIYGIVDNDKFKIKDINVPEKKGSTKFKSSGQDCKSTSIDKIIFYIMKFLITEETTFEQKMNTILSLIPQTKLYTEKVSEFDKIKNEELDSIMKKEGKEWKKLFPADYKHTIEEIKLFLFLKILGQKRSILCGFLLEKMRKNKLIIE